MKSYEELQKRIELFIDEDSNETFNELILEAHDFQKRNCQTLKNYTDQNCKNPQSWKEITPIPTEAFKSAKIISFPEKRISKTFLTSGTTGDSTGQHHFLDTSLYEKSILATWKKLNLPKLPLICLTQSHECNNKSSLIHMFKTLNGKYLINSSGEINFEKINSFFKHNHSPIVFAGTALAFLELIKNSSNINIKLPNGSWVLETGGYKIFFSFYLIIFYIHCQKQLSKSPRNEVTGCDTFYVKGFQIFHKVIL